MFIVLEGIDGSGKTSISKMLKNEFEKQGKKVFLTEEPTNKIFDVKSLMEKDLDIYTRIFIFMADRVEHIKEIKNYLKNGYIVISDRFVDSTFAYQGAILKNLFNDFEKSYNYINCIYDPFRFDPDLIFYLDTEPRIGISRITREKEYFERIEFLSDVRDFYKYLSEKRNYIKIDSNKGLNDVFNEILNHFKKYKLL